MTKELEAKVEYFTIKKPKYQRLYIQDDYVDTIVINEKEYKCSDIVKHEKALEIIKEIDKYALLQFICVCVRDQDKYDLLKEVLL